MKKTSRSTVALAVGAAGLAGLMTYFSYPTQRTQPAPEVTLPAVPVLTPQPKLQEPATPTVDIAAPISLDDVLAQGATPLDYINERLEALPEYHKSKDEIIRGVLYEPTPELIEQRTREVLDGFALAPKYLQATMEGRARYAKSPIWSVPLVENGDFAQVPRYLVVTKAALTEIGVQDNEDMSCELLSRITTLRDSYGGIQLGDLTLSNADISPSKCSQQFMRFLTAARGSHNALQRATEHAVAGKETVSDKYFVLLAGSYKGMKDAIALMSRTQFEKDIFAKQESLWTVTVNELGPDHYKVTSNVNGKLSTLEITEYMKKKEQKKKNAPEF